MPSHWCAGASRAGCLTGEGKALDWLTLWEVKDTKLANSCLNWMLRNKSCEVTSFSDVSEYGLQY